MGQRRGGGVGDGGVEKKRLKREWANQFMQ